jgi:hypothetical protein
MPMARKPKMIEPLDTDEALRRTVRICPLLARDTWVALRARVVVEAANEVVWRLPSQTSKFGDTYNVVQNALLINVALAIARVFDLSKNYPVERQDKASIPVLAHLLMREDVQQGLIVRSRDWTSDLIDGVKLAEDTCRDAIASALEVYKPFQTSSDVRDAQARLRQFRTRRLAHHLFDQEPDALPQINDVFLLADTAREFVRWTVLAIEGIDRRLEREAAIKLPDDFEFWGLALSATVAAEGPAPSDPLST